jgi:hypothetical protein
VYMHVWFLLPPLLPLLVLIRSHLEPAGQGDGVALQTGAASQGAGWGHFAGLQELVGGFGENMGGITLGEGFGLVSGLGEGLFLPLRGLGEGLVKGLGDGLREGLGEEGVPSIPVVLLLPSGIHGLGLGGSGDGLGLLLGVGEGLRGLLVLVSLAGGMSPIDGLGLCDGGGREGLGVNTGGKGDDLGGATATA